jgi:hypothetical protein
MIVEDFTGMQVGRLVPLEGTVGRCPRCGRNGVEERSVMAPPHFVHVQVTEMLPDGLLSEEVDCCPLGPPN